MMSCSVKCHARIGLMGNPSDGFEGKTLSFLLGNFFASVTMEVHDTVMIFPHPQLDQEEFSSIADLNEQMSTVGYYGGIRLLKATCKAFYDCVLRSGIDTTRVKGGFKMSYDSNIPRMVGLSGSSAIVVAAYKCLMQFFSVSLKDLKIEEKEFPNIILNIEKNELGISAGLQDRV